MMKRGFVALLSGGLDSSTLLAYLLRKEVGNPIEALAVAYGQRHTRELKAASDIAQAFGVPLYQTHIDPSIFHNAESSQTNYSVAVPHGHYMDESMQVTVVPNRNMLLLSLAAARAISLGYDHIAYAAHAGDHAIYPDCRPQFAWKMAELLHICHFSPIYLETPFLRKTKADIVALGHQLDVPFHLTYSCYEGQPLHCGLCGTCVERHEAFTLAGLHDPTQYGPAAAATPQAAK